MTKAYANDLQDIVRHKKIADWALKRLNELEVKSWNKKWNKDKELRRKELLAQRDKLAPLDIWANFPAYTKAVEQSKLGNCWERGTVFAQYASEYPEIGASHIYRVEAKGWDHVWSVLTTKKLKVDKYYDLTDLGYSGVVMDGWSEDWWYPNLDNTAVLKIGCWRFGTPFAVGLRVNIQSKYRQFKVQAKCC